MGVGKAIIGIAAVVLALSLFFTPIGHGVLNSVFDPVSKYPENSQYEMDRNISIDLLNNGMSYSVCIPKAEDYIVDGITLQKVNQQESNLDYDLSNEYGMDWMTWNGEGKGNHTIIMSYDVETYSYIWNIDESNSLTVDYIKDNLDGDLSYLKQYLYSESGDGSEWIPKVSGWNKGYVIYTGDEIKALSEEIVGSETNVYSILKLIYDWIDHNISYQKYKGIPQTALELLQSRNGDCDDQSVLFCSLARAAGVPAWLEMGALYNAGEGTWINHVWVQAYIPTNDGGNHVTIDVVNDKFLAHTSRLLHLATDNGSGELLNKYYYMYHYNYIHSNSQIKTSDSYTTHAVNDSDEYLIINPLSKKINLPSIYDIYNIANAPIKFV